MPSYKAPLRDLRFVLRELFGPQELPGIEAVDPEVEDAILEEGGKICAELLFPLSRSGDEEGCVFEDGEVKTPEGYPEAYATYCEAGWPGLSAAEEDGGQGLPHTLQMLFEEMLCSANLSFGITSTLGQGVYRVLEHYGSPEERGPFRERLASGQWAGTMCLTEPDAGTDLRLLRAEAVPQEDGSYRLSGSKIFISGGEHDLAENILHLVIARTPDAPSGIRGISLFLVPKLLTDPAGKLGERNGVRCGSLEHKMGIKASPTCTLYFENSEAYLIGELHQGMSAMFTMMNAARIAVGMQGLGLAETAYQNATQYAKERLQGRSLSGPKNPDGPADPIIVHPDVRRMLLTMRAQIEGGRALAAWTARALDASEKHPDPAERQRADDLVALMTPIVKAYLTDMGFEATNLGVQVLGGYGYVREYGLEQLVRDARVAQIYEGTNGIQALDLVGRKLPAHMGRQLRAFFHPVSAYLEERMRGDETPAQVLALAKAFGRLQRASATIAQKGLADPEEAGAAATDYLQLFALTALAYVWCLTIDVAAPRAAEDRSGYYGAKLATARFFFERILPRSSGHFAALMAGKGSLMELEEAAF